MTTTSMLPSSMWSRLSPGLQVMVMGGGGIFRRIGVVQTNRRLLLSAPGANQSDEFADAFGGLPDGPIIAEADDERAPFPHKTT